MLYVPKSKVSVDTIPQGLLKHGRNACRPLRLQVSVDTIPQGLLKLPFLNEESSFIRFQWILFRKVYSNSGDVVKRARKLGFSGYYSARFTQTSLPVGKEFSINVSVDTIPQGLLKLPQN